MLYLMCYPQRPLLQTKTIKIMKYHKMPAGHNASVAVLSYSGYDIEDAVIVNKGAIDRGFGKIIYRRRYESEVMKYAGGGMDRILGPELIEDKRRGGKGKRVKGKHRVLESDGLARIGERIREGEVFVNKETPKDPSSAEGTSSGFYPTPTVYKVRTQLLMHRIPTQEELTKCFLLKMMKFIC